MRLVQMTQIHACTPLTIYQESFKCCSPDTEFSNIKLNDFPIDIMYRKFVCMIKFGSLLK